MNINDKLSLSDLGFKRTALIKSLFLGVGDYLKGFYSLIFKNANSFFKFVKEGYHLSSSGDNILEIPVENMEEYLNIVLFLEGTRLFDFTKISLILNNPTNEFLALEILKKIDSNNILIKIPWDSLREISPLNTESLKINFAVDFTLTFKNYIQVYTETFTELIRLPFIQSLDLKIDYFSFEEMKFKDLSEFIFYLNRIKSWGLLKFQTAEVSSEEKVKTRYEENIEPTEGRKIRYNSERGCIKCFLDEELVLYLDPDLKAPYLNLNDFKNKNGEDIDYVLLDKALQLTNLKFYNPSFSNMYLINPIDNLKISQDLFVIPELTKIVGRVLE